VHEFYREKYPHERKFYDLLPPLLEKKYLKTIINCHKCAQTLDKGGLDGDGAMTPDYDPCLRHVGAGIRGQACGAKYSRIKRLRILFIWFIITNYGCF
jgi:hypothetical protein